MADNDNKEQAPASPPPGAGQKKPTSLAGDVAGPGGAQAKDKQMHKRVTKKDDGRSLIYYTFGEAT